VRQYRASIALLRLQRGDVMAVRNHGCMKS
jgi:hypothetical protein